MSDPFDTDELDITDIEELSVTIEQNPPRDISNELTQLDRLRLNLMERLGDPMRVKYDLVERNIAILNGIENTPDALTDPEFLRLYVGASKVIFTELDKLDEKWDKLSTRRTTNDQLKAFANIELFIEFITEYLDDSEFIIRQFVEFLESKNMFDQES
tara:strand:+ start:327 stop:800 length:474 start_codon:yes stop_codon:yes gene_type:complete